MKPLLLLDVDGVLNCFGSIWTEEYEREHFEPVDLGMGRFAIHRRKGLKARVARLLEVYEPVWATAWMEHAHAYWRRPLGLSEQPWPHITFAEAWVEYGKTWKLTSLADWVARHAPTTPLAWVDDDLHDDAEEWAAERNTMLGVRTMLVRTEPHLGLTDDHVELLRMFADELALR